MAKLTTVDEILDFAIDQEQKAVDFYLKLAAQADSPATAAVFEEYAQEELGHKAKILAVKAGKQLAGSAETVKDLQIGDYLVGVKADGNLSYQDALILAMKREKAAFRLYTELAGRTDNENMKNLFLQLAQEEAKHKLRFELEYDEQILKDN